MAETIYFKDGDTVWKADWNESDYIESPREFAKPLGKMVFERDSRHSYGDEQVEYWSDLFLEELRNKENIDYYRGEITFDLPSPEEAQKNPILKGFVNGNKQDGYFIDKPYFEQFLNSSLNTIFENSIEKCESLTGGILVDEETQKLSDKCHIDFKTLNMDSRILADSAFHNIYNQVSSLLENFGLKYNTKSFSIEDDLSESQLFEKWKETKACVIPIDIFEHSGVTCHEADVRKTLNVLNDRDDGQIYNSGFNYIDKDNEEFQSMIKDHGYTEEQAVKWAENVLKDEIKLYANYLEGDVHTVSTAYFDPKTLDWIENDYSSAIYGSSLEENLREHGFDTSNKLDSTKVFAIENSINPDFKKAAVEEFIGKVKENLTDFNNEVGLSAKCAMSNWKTAESVNVEKSDRFNRYSLKIQALTEFLNENKYTGDKFLDFLKENCGIREINNEIKPLTFRDPKEPERER